MKLPPAVIPLERRAPGLACWLIAIGALAMMLATAGALALSRAAGELARGIENRLIVQVIEADPERREASAREALALLRSDSGVAAARRIAPGEVARLIAPYIRGMDLADLPLPALLDATLAPSADADAGAIARRLRAVPGVRAERAGDGLAPLGRLVTMLRRLAAAIALLAAAATGAVAVLAARSALAAEAGTLAVLHGLGATDRQLARAITAGIARDAAIGAGIGALAGWAAIRAVEARLTALAPMPGLAATDWALLALLPVAIAALATGAAWLWLLASLRRRP